MFIIILAFLSFELQARLKSGGCFKSSFLFLPLSMLFFSTIR
jgi:hypothetical protein